MSARITYFVQAGDGGPIKIGMATNMTRRLRAIQTYNPNAVRLLITVPVDTLSEADAHALFADDRIRGEWFRPSVVLIAAIDTLRCGGRLAPAPRMSSHTRQRVAIEAQVYEETVRSYERGKPMRPSKLECIEEALVKLGLDHLKRPVAA